MGDGAELTHFVSVAGPVYNDSDESTEVKWVKRPEAMETISFPLTRKRLANTLFTTGKFHRFDFCFRADDAPFEITEESDF